MERGGCESRRGEVIYFFRSFGGPARQSFEKLSPYLFLPVRRRETIKTLEYFFGCRVLRPPVTLPHMVFGLLVPRPCRPSPPPYGWSTGFIAVPRTVGLMPFQRLRPALP